MGATRREFPAKLGIGEPWARPPSEGRRRSRPRPSPPRKPRGRQRRPQFAHSVGWAAGKCYPVKNGQVVSIEGDRHHPNEGSLCSKGAAASQVTNNPLRLKTPLYRAPGSDRWEEKPLDWMLPRIAQRVKATIRDASFQAEVGGVTVNRTEAIASLGGAALDNEECYLLVKLMRALGIVYLEHQARI
jgi:anaerobic selenocysteine-containing dehydrogenase